MLTSASFHSAEKCCHNRVGRVQARGKVSNRYTNLDWGSIALSSDVH